jgi:hypothetical protein
MVVNFRVREISQGTHKLIRTSTLIKNKRKKEEKRRKKAFLKATTVVKSRATSIFTDLEESDDCIQEPGLVQARDASDKQSVPLVLGALDMLVGVEVGKEMLGS